MIALQAGDLIYDGAGKHLIHGLTKSSIGDSYRLAEGTLDSIGYADYPSTLHKLALRNTDIALRQDIGNYVKEIHHKYKSQIESKGDKKMTDDEVSDLIYRETLEDELNKISKVINGEIIL